MKDRSFKAHLSEFIQHCKEEIHFTNILKAKAVLIGGAGLKMLASQSLMMQFIGVKMLALKAAVAKMGIFAFLSATSLGNILGIYASGGFSNIIVDENGGVLVEWQVGDENDPDLVTITYNEKGDTTNTTTVLNQAAYSLGETSFDLLDYGTYEVTLVGYDEQGNFVEGESFLETVVYENPLANTYVEFSSIPTSSIQAETGQQGIILHTFEVETYGDVAVELNEVVFNASISGTSNNDLSQFSTSTTLQAMTSQGPQTIGEINGMTFTDLSFSIPGNATQQFMIVADISSSPTLVDASGNFSVSSVSTSSNGQAVQTTPGTNTPSSVFVVLGSQSGLVEVNGITLSNIDTVLGSQDVDTLLFEIENENSNYIHFEQLQIDGTSSAGSFDSSLITNVKLWEQTSTGFELLEEQVGAASMMLFASFSPVEIPTQSTKIFLVTTSVSENQSVVGTTYQVQGSAVEISDSNQNTLIGISDAIPFINSDRDVYVTDSGVLTVQVDNIDSLTDTPKHVIAGSSESVSPFIASFELIAENEPMELEDVSLEINSPNESFYDAVTEIVVYGDDYTTEIDRRIVTGQGDIMFNNIDFSLDEGSTNIYIKVVTDNIGTNFNGSESLFNTVTFNALSAVGVDSNNDVQIVNSTSESHYFNILSVALSDAEFTESYGVEMVENEIYGQQNNVMIGILEVSADSRENTELTNDTPLEILLERIDIQTSAEQGLVESYSIKRLDISNSSVIIGSQNGSEIVFFIGNNNERVIGSEETAHYGIYANTNNFNSNSSFNLTANLYDEQGNNAFLINVSDPSLQGQEEIFTDTTQIQSSTIFYYPDGTSGPICGNGVVEGDEQCDDGNTENNDGCNMFCMNDTSSSCDYVYTIDNIQYLGNSTFAITNVPNCDLVVVEGDIALPPSMCNDGTYTWTTQQDILDIQVGGSESTCVYGFSIPVPDDGPSCDYMYGPSDVTITNSTATFYDVPGCDDVFVNGEQLNGCMNDTYTYDIQTGVTQLMVMVGSDQTGCNYQFTLDVPTTAQGGNSGGGNTSNPGSTTSFCGNSFLELGEECDDGNTASGDGCSSTCQMENIILDSIIAELLEDLQQSWYLDTLQDFMNDLLELGTISAINSFPEITQEYITQLEYFDSDESYSASLATANTLINMLAQDGHITVSQNTLDELQEEVLASLLEELAGENEVEGDLNTLLESLDDQENAMLNASLQVLETELENQADVYEIVQQIDSQRDLDELTNNPAEKVLEIRKENIKEGIKDLLNTDDDKEFEMIEEGISDIEFAEVIEIRDIIIESIGDVPVVVQQNIEDTLRTRATGNQITHFELNKALNELNEDSDLDGVADIIEDSTINNGDANFDGTPDKQQRAVSTIPTIEGEKKITIDTTQSNSCGTVTKYVSTSQDTIGVNDTGYDYPLGLNRFELECSEATIRVYYHDIELGVLRSMDYRKYDSNDGYFDLPVEYGEENGIPYVEFTIQDGSIYDDSPAGDGIIIDDNGPAVGTTVSSGRSGGVASSIEKTGQRRPLSSDKTHGVAYPEKKGPKMKPKIQLGTHHTRPKMNHGAAITKSLRSAADSFKKLLSIEVVTKYQDTNLFSGRTLEFYKIVLDGMMGLSSSEQITKLEGMTNNLETLTEEQVSEYGVSKGVLLTIFKSIVKYSKGEKVMTTKVTPIQIQPAVKVEVVKTVEEVKTTEETMEVFDNVQDETPIEEEKSELDEISIEDEFNKIIGSIFGDVD